MRLTLRTMLAYMDDMLQPADSVELGRRIAESKFAADLLDRIRSCAKRSRLAAPKVDGRGIGLDPNSVAEYLDSTLPPDRVAEFETVCLESEVHLAEVACCHQVLARVMAGEPSPIPTGLRERMIALADPAVEERVRRARKEAKKAAAEAFSRERQQVEAPPIADELAIDVSAPPVSLPEPPVAPTADSPLPWRAMAIALGLAFLLVLGTLRILGPFDQRHPLAQLVVGERRESERGREVASAASGDDAPAAANRTELDDAPAAPRDLTREGIESQELDEGLKRAAGAKLAAGEGDDERMAAADPAGEPAKESPVDESADAGRPVAPELSDVAAAAAPVRGRATEPASRGRGSGAGAAGGTAGGAPGLPAAGAAKRGAAALKEKGSVAGETLEVARFVSDDQVLAHLDPKDRHWYRLSRGAALVTSESYVALPLYRPQIVASDSAQAMFVGPAAFELTAPPAGEMGGGIALQSGKAILAPTGRPGMRVPLRLAGLGGLVVFGDANAELAVEVRYWLTPGSDPAEVAPQITRLLFARRGAIEWQAGDGDPIRIPPDHVLALVDGVEPTIEPAAFPAWTDVRNLSKLDRDSYEQLEMALPDDRPLTLSLQERLEFRKTEIRSLAARSLASLGNYEPLFRELANEQQHSYWDRAVDELREALARGPDEVERLREVLARIRPEDADTMLRLLRDYSPEQLETQGGAAELVGLLDHKSLDLRVLAFESLRRITGATLYYRPEAPAERRRVPLQKWRERLKDGLVTYKTPPAPPPLLDRKAASKPESAK